MAYDNAMNCHSLFPYNMLIASSGVFDAYCEWLFPILFRLEQQISLEGRDVYQRRVFGFLSERLMDVWVRANSVKVLETPVILEESRLKERISMKIAEALLCCRGRNE